MHQPLPSVASIRDFYAFEQHVKTCRQQRGLDMAPQWYEVPVFYFSNPAGVIGQDDPVAAPSGSKALDYELELACIIGKECRDLPADDRAMDFVAGYAPSAVVEIVKGAKPFNFSRNVNLVSPSPGPMT